MDENVVADYKKFESTVLNLNKSAIEALHSSNFQAAYYFLVQANNFLRQKHQSPQVQKLQAVTFNNFGCLYRNTDDLKKSLAYFIKSLSIEENLDSDPTNKAGTMLNISSIFQQMEDYHKSLAYGIKAIKEIETNYEYSEKAITTLIIAYQSSGNALSKIGKRPEAKSYVAHGYKLALKFFGNSDLAASLKKSLDEIVNSENPVIEKMLNFFRNHMRVIDDKKYSPKKIVKKVNFARIQEPKSKINSNPLQPIVDIRPNKQAQKKPDFSPMRVARKPEKEKVSQMLHKNSSVSPMRLLKKPDAIKSKENLSSSLPAISKNKVNSLGPGVNRNISSIKKKITNIQDKLVNIGEKIDSVKDVSQTVLVKDSIAEKRKKRKEKEAEREKKKMLNNKYLVIQKNVRGWIARKKFKKLRDSVIKIQRAFRARFRRKKQAIIRKLGPNEFSQQFSYSILRYDIDQKRKPKSKKVQTSIDLIPKRSFTEKILLIQKHVKLYLNLKKKSKIQ